MRTIAFAAILATAAADCTQTAPTVAQLFTVDASNDGYKIVTSTAGACNGKYVLYPRGTAQPALGDDYRYFATPLLKVALTQTVSNTFIEILGASSAATVISSYTTSACLHKRVEDGSAVEYTGPADQWGGGDDAAHAEQMSGVDAVFTDPFGASSFYAGNYSAKTICTAETYETEQLSQAEWVKFYGLFFDKEAEASASMCSTASRFSCSAIEANSKSNNQGPSYQSPTVAFASVDWNSDFKINTVPKTLALIRHAGAAFPDMSAYDSRLVMHYTGVYAEGYKWPAGDAAEFREALAKFDVVIDETYPNQQTQATIATKYGVENNTLPAFAAGRVYTLDKSMSYNAGASDIFESAIAQPDNLLSDLIAVLHLDESTAAEAAADNFFVRHAASGSVTLNTVDQCVAEPVVRPSTCETVFTHMQSASGLLLPEILQYPTGGQTESTSVAGEPYTADLFTVCERDGYKIVTSTAGACNGKYVLYPRGSAKPALGDEYRYFATPLLKVALTQTVSNTFLELIGASSAATVISSYTTSACLHKRVEDGLAVEYTGPADEYGGGDDAAHAEQMSGVDAVFTDPFGATSFYAGDYSAKTICTAETYETEQLSQAEWVKFYGLFFDKEAEASESMCSTASRFSCSAIEANGKSASQGPRYQAPTVALASKDWNSDFKINTVPKTLALIRHAGAAFPDMSAYDSRLVMHYTGVYAEGYKWPAADAAEFREALALFDVVIDESYPYEQTQETIATMYGVEDNTIPAFTAGRVYTFDKSMSYNGGASDIFESAIAQPDNLLSDLIAVLHADESAAVEAAADTSYVRHAAEGAITRMTVDQCQGSPSQTAASCAETAGQLGIIASVGAVVDTCPTVGSLTYPQCPALPAAAAAAFPVGGIVGVALGGVVILILVGLAVSAVKHTTGKTAKAVDSEVKAQPVDEVAP